MSKQVFSQFLVVIAIYRKDILEQILYNYGNHDKSKIQISSVKIPSCAAEFPFIETGREGAILLFLGRGWGEGRFKQNHGFHPYCFRD